MTNFRKNMFGFAHHAVLGLVVIGVVSLAGVRVLTGTHAAPPRYTVGGFVTHNGVQVAKATVFVDSINGKTSHILVSSGKEG